MKTLLRLCFALGLPGLVPPAAVTVLAPNSRASATGYHLETCQAEIPGTINPSASFLPPPAPGPGYGGDRIYGGKEQNADNDPAQGNNRNATKVNDRGKMQSPAATKSQNSAPDSDDED